MSDFSVIADQMESLAQNVRDLGDQVHLGTYTVGAEPPPEPAPVKDAKK